MPRLASIDPATDTGPGADILNGPLKAKQINIFKGLAAHPPVLQAFLEFAGGVKGGALTPAEHEVVALVMSTKNECRYCAAAHTKVASTVARPSTRKKCGTSTRSPEERSRWTPTSRWP